MTLLANSFEGGSNGATVTTGNSGGASGDTFDAVSIGSGAALTYSTTRAAHGTVSCSVSTGVTSTSALARWSASMGSQVTVWFRMYLYFTANPPNVAIIFRALQGSTQCGSFSVNTDGTLSAQITTGGGVITTVSKIPLNQWFRVEGFLTGSSSAGQLQVKLFAGSVITPTETVTSSAAQNTFGAPNTYDYGCTRFDASIGPFWMDGIGLSDTGYIGPVTSPSPAAGSSIVAALRAMNL